MIASTQYSHAYISNVFTAEMIHWISWGAVDQWLVRRTDDREVVGSNPAAELTIPFTPLCQCSKVIVRTYLSWPVI